MDTASVLINEIVSTYEDIDDETPCSFALISNDGESSELFPLEVCHSELQSIEAKVFDQLFTSYPIREPIDQQFFLFMKNHLYRKFSDFIQLGQAEDGSSYIHITDLSAIPANVVYNICICSRFPIEYRDELSVWAKLCDEGLNPGFAFAVCRFNSSNLDEKMDAEWLSDQEHWPFYITASMKALMQGEPANNCPTTYKENPANCCPTNTIWGHTKDMRGINGLAIREFWEKWKDAA